MNLQYRLKEATYHAHRNQSDIARKLRITRATVSLWFTGSTKSMKGSHLLQVADYLGVSVPWLEFGEGQMLPSLQKYRTESSHEAQLHSCKFMSLNPLNKEKANEYLDLLLLKERAR